MIDIKKLVKDDVGREVVYTSYGPKIEEGKITSWNDIYIFVDYGKRFGAGDATSPMDLAFKDPVRDRINTKVERWELIDIEGDE